MVISKNFTGIASEAWRPLVSALKLGIAADFVLQTGNIGEPSSRAVALWGGMCEWRIPSLQRAQAKPHGLSNWTTAVTHTHSFAFHSEEIACLAFGEPVGRPRQWRVPPGRRLPMTFFSNHHILVLLRTIYRRTHVLGCWNYISLLAFIFQQSFQIIIIRIDHGYIYFAPIRLAAYGVNKERIVVARSVPVWSQWF